PALQLEEHGGLVADRLVAGHHQAVGEHDPAGAAGGDAPHPEQRAADHGHHVRGAPERFLAHELILWRAVIMSSMAAALAPSRCAWATMSRRRWSVCVGSLVRTSSSVRAPSARKWRSGGSAGALSISWR